MDPYTALFGNQYQKMMAPAGAATAPPRMLDILPPVDPETERSRIGSLMENSLGGLAYIGKMLDKPGRAVRGLLGGTPEELLNLIPFSDSLGITDERNRVSGRQLLYNAGMVSDPNGGSEFEWDNDLAGLGVEMLTDPLFYLTFGSTTAAGRAAMAAGTQAKGLRNAIAAGERGLLGVGLPFRNASFHLGTTTDSLDNLLTAGSWARSGLTMPTRAFDYASNAALGMKPLSSIQDVVTNTASSIYAPIKRVASGLFDPPMMGMMGRGQEFAPELYQLQNTLKRESLGTAADLDAKAHLLRTGIDPLMVNTPKGGQVLPPMSDDQFGLALRTAQDMIEGLPEVGGKVGLKLPAGINKAGNVTDAYDVADQILKMGTLTTAQETRLTKHVMDIDNLLSAGQATKAQKKLDQFNDVLVPKLVGAKMWDYGGTLAAPLPPVNSLQDVLDVGDLIRANPMLSRAERQAAGKLMDDAHLVNTQMMTGQAPTKDPIAEMMGLTEKVFRRGVGDGAKPIESLNIANARKVFTPEQFDQIKDLGGFTEKMYADILRIEGQTAAKGAGKQVASDFIDYAFRQSQKIPRVANETLDKYNERLFNAFQADHKALTRRSDILDVPGGTDQLRSLAKDPRLSGPNRTLSDKEVVREIREQLSGTKFPDPKSEVAKQAKRLSKWLKGLDPEYSAKGADLFSVDMTGLAISRLAKKDKLLVAEDAVDRALKYIDTNGNIIADGLTPVSVPDFLKSMNMAFEKDGVATPLVQRLMSATGKSPKELKDMHLPIDIANDVLRINKAWDAPPILKPVLAAADYMSNLFKGLTTRPFPAYWTRNINSDMFQQFRGGALTAEEVAQGLPSVKSVFGFMRGSKEDLMPGMSAEQFQRELIQAGEFKPNMATKADVVGPGDLATYRGIQRVPDQPSGNTAAGDVWEYLKDTFSRLSTKAGAKEGLNPLNVSGAGTDTDRFVLAKAFSDAGEFGNRVTRGSHYLSLRKQGYTPEAAAASMHKYQLDYSEMTQFERSVAKRLIPWYSYSRRMLPTVIEDAVKQPSYLAAPIRAMTGGRQEGEFVPGYIAEGASIPIGGAPEGQQRYITSFGLPFEDEAIKTLGSVMSGDLRRGAETLLSQTMPWIKFPMEYTFDKQLYSGRPLSELKPYEYATLGGLLSEPQARLLTTLVSQSPGARGANTLNRVLDDRKGVVEQIANLATGVRISDVDYDRARDANTRRLLEQLLEGQTGVRRQTGVYIPTDRVNDIPQSEGELYRMYLNVEQRMRDAARNKRKVGSELPMP